MAYYEDLQFNEFFSALEEELREHLPLGLAKFKWQRPGNNYVRIKYSSKMGSYYELQFSDHSQYHREFFGEGPHIVLAFYIETSKEDRSTWLDVVTPYVEYICKLLGTCVKCGYWGTRWACLITNLDNLPIDAEHFSKFMAYFIQATFLPITLAFKGMRN